jgi:glutaredoxin-like protein NrdH
MKRKEGDKSMKKGSESHGVESTQQSQIVLYALSTCVWCRKTKKLLDSLGVKYRLVEVDLLDGVELEHAEDEVRKHNPMQTFPTLVINSEKSIAGYNEDEIRKAFTHG